MNLLNKLKETKIQSYLIVSFVLSVFTIYSLIILFSTWPITEFSLNKSGLFGDSFGALSSLFSGLAFGGLIIAILLQRDDLKVQNQNIELQLQNIELQREDLKLQRQDIKIQTDELRLTREELQKQSIENTFFQMIRLFNEIVNSVDLVKRRPGKPDLITSGRDCFRVFFERLQNNYVKNKNMDLRNTPKKQLENAYDLFWRNNAHELGHYFRFLYRVFKFINDLDIGGEEKFFYSTLIRSQLSDFELVLLFYHCISKQGCETFKPLAEKFSLFDNLHLDYLLDEPHKQLINQSAFGSYGLLG